MKARCYNPNHPDYANYGGRGIRVCERWLSSYAAFITDMGARPSSAHSLDRRDNDCDYSLDNCRWATAREQNNNRRINRLITFRGETYTLTEWARMLGMNYTTLQNRLDRGWSIEDALMIEVDER